MYDLYVLANQLQKALSLWYLGKPARNKAGISKGTGEERNERSLREYE